MRNDRLVPGVILVLIGAAFLLHNYGYLHFHLENFWYLWPILIVIGGINLIFAHNRSVWATAIKLGVIIIGFGLLIFGNFGNHFRFWPTSYYSYQHDNDDNNDENDDDDSTSTKSGVVKVQGNSFFNEPYTADTRVARLNVSGGATTYKLSDTTNQLFTANSQEFFGKYEFNRHKEDSVYVLDFEMKDHNGHHGWNIFNHHNSNDKSNTAIFKLNPNPIWEFNIEAGATDLDFDLSKFKVKTLSLSGGAGSFKIKLGQPLASTKVDVSAGMADINISVPQNAACQITSDSALSSNDFKGFNKTDDDTYETAGFATAKNKIYISIDGGLASFKVSRY